MLSAAGTRWEQKLFLAALKQYAASPQKDLNRLNAYAKKMSLTNVVRQYLQVLL